MSLSHTLLKPHNSTTGEFIDKRWIESSHYTTKHSYIRFKGTWFPLEHHHNENARGYLLYYVQKSIHENDGGGGVEEDRHRSR